MKTFKIDILTPTGIYYKGEAEYLSIRNEQGVLGILPNHIPLITTVVLGKVILTIKGKRHVYATTGGLLHIKEDRSISLMLKTIERSDEIDLERAKRSKKRAEDRIKNNKGDLQRAEASLKRAELRIEVGEENNK